MRKKIFLFGVLFACFFSVGVLGDSVFAYDDDPDSLTLSVSDNTLYIGALVPGDFASSNGVDITIDTTNETGYQLSASVGSSTYNTRDLVHSINPQAKFSSLAITESTAITRAATWGYSTTYGLTYSGLPLYNDEENVLILSSSDEPSYDTVNFRIGAKAASDQATGEYSNIINFLAVTNPIPEPTYPYMQDATAELLVELMPNAGDIATLEDSRTGEVYDIVKLASDQYFMASNLKVPAGTTLGPEDSNVSSDYTLSTEEWTNGTNYQCRQMVGVADGEYYYNWYAATTNPANDVVDPSDLSCANETRDSYTLGDICPKGWRLPTGSEVNSALVSDYIITSTLMSTGSYYDGHSVSVGIYGGWWSSDRTDFSDIGAVALGWGNEPDPTTYGFNSYKNIGYSVRCVFGQSESGSDVDFDGTMQGVTDEYLDSVEIGDVISMVDARANYEEYEISVINLRDSKTFWMDENLRLPAGTMLTPSDSNVSSNFTLSSDMWPQHEAYHCQQLMAEVDGEYYYNGYAARANPYTGAADPTDSSCASDAITEQSLGDICPKGWRLPDYYEIWAMESMDSVKETLNLPGYFAYGSVGVKGLRGQWWSSDPVRNSTGYGHLLDYINGNASMMGLSYSYGLSVRCVYVMQ